MQHYTGTAYSESSQGDLPTTDNGLDFGANTQIVGTSSVSDADLARFDVRQAGASDFNPNAPTPGSQLHVTVSAPNVTYFDFGVFDPNLNEVYRKIYDGTLTQTSTNFSVDTTFNVPDVDYLNFDVEGFAFVGGNFQFAPVSYTLTVNGTPAGGAGPTVITLSGPGVIPEGNVGDRTKMTFTLTRSGSGPASRPRCSTAPSSSSSGSTGSSAIAR